ncbi:MAG: methyltransferase domain-containing protein, partial [Vicinamibacterales bacterium]|nr:methyltransferase domain-containing protein [Vicinamibacterales bacterium]
GCGTGLGGALWRAKAAHLVGVDLSAEMVARSRTRAIYDRLETAEITRWLAQTASDLFDLVLACDTLIYFGDLAQVVEPAAKKLRPGGLLGFTVERGDTDPFRLSDSGRFTHHPNHVTSVAANAGLTLLSLDETTVRYEYGEPVTGLIAVCQG